METGKHRLTIITYNIFDGRNTEKIIQNILGLIQNGASVICLQEVRQVYRYIEFTKLLAARLPAHFSARYYLEGDARWFDYGLGILWDTDVFSAATFSQLPLPEQTRLTFWNKLFYWVLGLQPKIIKRGALIGTFSVGQKKIRITNIHLDFQGGNAHRANQLKSLMHYLTSELPVYCEIMCGDFNTLGVFGKKIKILVLEQQLGGEYKSVLRTPYNSAIIQQLDYIFTKNIQVQQVKVLKLKGSDHRPLLTDIQI